MAYEICEKWYHTDCQNISEQVYEFLVKEGNNVHWFCDKCNGAAAEIYKMVCAVKVKQDSKIETKVDSMTEKVELLENMIEANMDAKIAELRRDQEEIEKPRTSLIIYEVAESTGPDTTNLIIYEVAESTGPDTTNLIIYEVAESTGPDRTNLIIYEVAESTGPDRTNLII